MPDTNDKIKALFNAASQKFDVGTEQEFRQNLMDSSKRKALFDAVSQKFDLGTYSEYENNLGPTQKSIDDAKAMAAKVPSFKDFAAERGIYVPRVGEIQVPSDIVERVPSLSRKAEIAKNVEEAPERIRIREEKKELAKIDALKNNTAKALKASGTKFIEGDAVYKKMQESIRLAIDNGAMTLSADAAGNPIYKRSAGIVESYINNLEASRKDIKDSEIFRKSDDKESVMIAEEIMKVAEEESIPSGGVAEFAGMVGSATPILGRAIIGGSAASKLLPGPAKIITALGSFLSTISPSYDQAYKQGAIKLYAKGIEEVKRQKRISGLSEELTQEEKEEAMRMAKGEASVSGLAEGIFTAGLSSIPLGAPVAGQSFKKALVNFAKNTAKEVPRNVSLGAASEVIKDVSARNAGYNITTAETLDNILNRGEQDLVTTLAFEVGFNIGEVAKVPKYVKAAATNYLSTIPTLEFNNFAKELEGRGVVEPGFAEKAAADVSKFNESKAKVASFIPEEDMPSFAGLIEKKTNLENQKKTTDPSFHAKIDEQISAVDARIKKMQESPNPIFDEVDELTGDTGDATPITETEIEKSIEYADGYTPATKETIDASDVSKKLQYYQESNPIKLEDINGGFMITGGLTDLQTAAQKADKKTTITEPTKIQFLPENISLVHLARSADDAKSIVDNGFNIEEVNIDSPVPGVYFSSEDWSTMDRFGREKSNALLTEIKNDGLVYFDNTDDFRKFLNNNNLPSQGQTLSKGQINLLKSKGIKGILLREDFASNSRNELIVIDPSIIQSVKKYSGEETTNLPSSFSDANLIADVYKKYKQEGTNPEFIKLVEQKLSEAPTEINTEQEIERLRAAEQTELESAIPNIEEYKVDGIVDRTKITNEEDLAKFDEIYNKYDKLITPLLEAPKEAAKEVPKEVPLIISPEKITSEIAFSSMTQKELMGKVNEIGELQDPEGLVMKAFLLGAKVSEESYKKEFLGRKSGKVKRRGKLIDEARATTFTKKEGQTIPKLAHRIWEGLPEDVQRNMDDGVLANAIIEVMNDYDNIPDLRLGFVERFYPKEMSDADYMNFLERNKEEVDPITTEWESWMRKEGEKEMALELDEAYVDELIKQYEQELTGKDAGIARGKEERVAEEIVGTDITKKEGIIEGESVKKYIDEQATPEESTNFSDFSKRELGKEGFDAEYKSARVEGETKEQYLIRKYCK